MQPCPKCGEPLRSLDQSLFCLNCDWDNLPRLKGRLGVSQTPTLQIQHSYSSERNFYQVFICHTELGFGLYLTASFFALEWNSSEAYDFEFWQEERCLYRALLNNYSVVAYRRSP